MVSPSGKQEIKFNVSTFVAEKNDFCRKFVGLSVAKDLVEKFNSACSSTSTAEVSNTTVTLGTEAVISGGEEIEGNTARNFLKTPSKKGKGGRKWSAIQQPDGAELVSPEKAPKVNLVDEEIEAHYIGMLFYIIITT